MFLTPQLRSKLSLQKENIAACQKMRPMSRKRKVQSAECRAKNTLNFAFWTLHFTFCILAIHVKWLKPFGTKTLRIVNNFGIMLLRDRQCYGTLIVLRLLRCGLTGHDPPPCSVKQKRIMAFFASYVAGGFCSLANFNPQNTKRLFFSTWNGWSYRSFSMIIRTLRDFVVNFHCDAVSRRDRRSVWYEL